MDFYVPNIRFFIQSFRNGIIGLAKDLTAANKVTSSEAQPDARDYYWFKSPIPNQLS